MSEFLEFVGSIFEFIGDAIELVDLVDWFRSLIWGVPAISAAGKGDLPPTKLANGREILARKSTTTVLTRRPRK